MTALALRFIAALLATYFLSRLLLRVPTVRGEMARLVVVHGLSALLLGAWVIWLRQVNAAAGWIVAAQLCWFALDWARGRGVTAPAV